MGKTFSVSDFLQLTQMAAHLKAKREGKALASFPPLVEGVRKGTIRGTVRARQWLALPESGGTFRKGKDITDSGTGISSLPWEFVKDLDILRPGIGLYIDPEDLKAGASNITIITPKTVTIIGNGGSPIIQESWERGEGVKGKPDVETMVPLQVSNQDWVSLPPEQRMLFLREGCQTLRPLACGSPGVRVYADELTFFSRPVAFE